MSGIVTTSGRPDEQSVQLAANAAEVLGFPVVERKKRSIVQLQADYKSDVIIAGKNRFDLYRIGMDAPFFFHPNSAAFRLKRLLKGEKDPLIETAQLQSGDSFLDCTLGLASDSIIASYVVGESGFVTGVEADSAVAFITRHGLHTFPTESVQLKQSMARVNVIHARAIDFLRTQSDSTWDVVYLDPMFHAPVEESSNFTALRQSGFHSSLTEEWMEQAVRVSKRRVVVKSRYDSPVFEQFELKQMIRPNTKFHFGFKEK
ncbi:class I SAM-dependent methyltransferase [Filibacter tadaridae]|uniref:Ribosomal RNA small subunit methyltransferase J n=1 Tax=Filibacter tadaridae TaxID=2483811 RepID=A0A3P5XFL8_9BACL|nr:class I SAM-dependent methyltransferase [Filibacter tadaridae]VDC29018.1 Ribosomal RNA small subunit methyltransferase J [Filibacter tadaridae]